MVLNNLSSVMVYRVMKKAGTFLSVLLLMSITFHLYYDVVTQLNLAHDGKSTELSGEFYSARTLRAGFHSAIVHTHDFVIHNSFNYCIQTNEYASREPFIQFLYLPLSDSACWHPPQTSFQA